MRRVFFGAVLLSGLMVLLADRPAEAQASVSISFFQDQLAPYGQWAVSASLGDVWVPSVPAGWGPYVNGEWVYTDYGWTWVASDPFDVPFHYGTWAWDDRFGWVWVPGTVWAPAWVTWAVTDDYVGWAPLPPSFALSASGYVGAPVVVTETRYVFVPTNRFVGVNVSSARVPQQQNTTIFRRTTKVTSFGVSNGIVRNSGPEPARIEKAVGRKVERASVERVKTKPTTLSAAGASTSARVQVAAPAEQRRSAIQARGAGGRPAAGPPSEKPGVQSREEPARQGAGRVPTARGETSRRESVAPRERPEPGKGNPEARPERPEKGPEKEVSPEARREPKPKKPTPKPEGEKSNGN